MVTIKIVSDDQKNETEELIRSALSAEIKKMEFSLFVTLNEIKKFEEKYHISSDIFLREKFAEDMTGKDDEYIEWFGEIQVRNRIESDLKKLKEIHYENH